MDTFVLQGKYVLLVLYVQYNIFVFIGMLECEV